MLKFRKWCYKKICYSSHKYRDKWTQTGIRRWRYKRRTTE